MPFNDAEYHNSKFNFLTEFINILTDKGHLYQQPPEDDKFYKIPYNKDDRQNLADAELITSKEYYLLKNKTS